MYSNSHNKPYILDTILYPNHTYSTLGLQIRVEEEVDTFSNNGNFTIYLKNINLQKIQQDSRGLITKDTPIFCYVQENKQTFSTKLQDNNLAFKIDIHREIKRDSNNNIILQNPAFILLSFFPFKNSYQAHTTSSQKLQILVEDIARGYIIKDFRIPLIPIQKSEIFQEWIRDSYRNKIVDMYLSYGKDCIKIKDISENQDDVNLHILMKQVKENEEVSLSLQINDKILYIKGIVNSDNEVVVMNAIKGMIGILE